VRNRPVPDQFALIRVIRDQLFLGPNRDNNKAGSLGMTNGERDHNCIARRAPRAPRPYCGFAAFTVSAFLCVVSATTPPFLCDTSSPFSNAGKKGSYFDPGCQRTHPS
jgi:hypothetical protein